MKPKDEKKIAQIYEVTPQLVLRKGLSGVTMSDIAKAAKIATGTLYIYFESKEELISTVFEHFKKASRESYLKGYDEKEPFKIAFKKIWTNMFKYRLEHFDELIFIEQCTHSLYTNHTLKYLNMQQMQPLLCIMERGKKEKLLKDLDGLTMLVVMVGGVNQLVKHIQYTQSEISKEMIEVGFSMCWDGLKK
jgi:AcrR family transcriptional regulator